MMHHVQNQSSSGVIFGSPSKVLSGRSDSSSSSPSPFSETNINKNLGEYVSLHINKDSIKAFNAEYWKEYNDNLIYLFHFAKTKCIASNKQLKFGSKDPIFFFK